MGCTGQCGDVLEFGCGYGTFTVPAASLVAGQIFALDIEAAMIAATEKKVREANLSNIVLERRDFLTDGCGRPDASVGYAILFNILHVENPVGLLREAWRTLKPGGLAGIIHWKHDPKTPRGPTLEIRPTPEQCRAWAATAGFEFVRDESLCCCSWHFGLIVRKPL
jgi:ubiquinone/menaquinone biosynthesis C-methylase UbiE